MYKLFYVNKIINTVTILLLMITYDAYLLMKYLLMKYRFQFKCSRVKYETIFNYRLECQSEVTNRSCTLFGSIDRLKRKVIQTYKDVFKQFIEKRDLNFKDAIFQKK